MKILFSPSEAKRSGGKRGEIERDSFCFEALFDLRMTFVNQYRDYVLGADDAQLSMLFGIKKADQIAHYRQDILSLPLLKAIERYSGVAYEYLDYEGLHQEAQAYIDENVMIFSNLFGPICAQDQLPEYKFKQGAKLDGVAPENYYKEHFTQALDQMLEGEEILDLRAGFYDKFYKPSHPYTTLKFIKNGKVVSHWAKAYRGTVLREIAKEQIETIEAFMDLEIENLKIKEILEKGKQKEIIYEII